MPSVSASPTRLKFWGTRGSISVPGPGTLRYGGNTTCVEVRADGEIIVLDAGSGIRSLGIALEKEFRSEPIKLSLLITHAHWDHIQGLPFFAPAYEKKNEIHVRGYDGVDTSFGKIMAEPMRAPFFPIAMRELSARVEIKKLTEMEFSAGNVRLGARFVNHPGVCAGYRLFTSAGSIAFLPDHEPYRFLHSAKSKNKVMLDGGMVRFPAPFRLRSMRKFAGFCSFIMTRVTMTQCSMPWWMMRGG